MTITSTSKADSSDTKPLDHKVVNWVIIKDCPQGAWQMLIVLDNGAVVPISEKDGITKEQIAAVLGEVKGFGRMFHDQCALST